MNVYKNGIYAVNHISYNCHPETCSHFEHYPYVIIKDGKFYKFANSESEAVKEVKTLVKSTT